MIFRLFALLLVTASAAAYAAGFSNAASMATGRQNHTSTLLPNGKVLVTGGYNGTVSLNSVELYDPSTNSWSSAPNLDLARRGHSATLLPNGKVMIVGGLLDASPYYVPTVRLYDSASNTWSSAADIGEGRHDHTATLLQNGKVLIAGGARSSSINSAELYDPATNTWSPAGTLSKVRSSHAAVLLPNGKVLVIGGYSGNSGRTASAELYDPAANSWTTVASMATERDLHIATLLPNGKVLVAGGYDGNNGISAAEIYDPAANSWSSANSMSTVRESAAATLLTNGKVIVTGGMTESSLPTTTDVYDYTTNSWSAGGSMTLGRMWHNSTLLLNGKVLLTGGYATASPYYSPTAVIYDPGTSPGWSSAGNMSVDRMDLTATVLPNGNVLAVGGFGNNGSSVLAAADIYNPITNSWTAAASLNAPRWRHKAVLMPNGRVLVVGGSDSTNQGAVATAEVYNPIANSWTPAASMATARTYCSATLLANGKVLVAGGLGSDYFKTAELYDPTSNSWSPAASMATGRYAHSATLLPNGKVLVAGGHGDAVVYATAELYDPVANSWSSAQTMANSRYDHTATLLPNGKVFVTGAPGGLASAKISEIYDPATNSWSSAASSSVRHFEASAALLPNGRVLIAGDYGATAAAEVYDPLANTWATVGNMSSARQNFAMVLLTTGKAIAIGGSRDTIGGATNASAESFDIGLPFQSSFQPVITSASDPAFVGLPLSLSGTGFTGISEGSFGLARSSPSNFPFVQLRSLGNNQIMTLSPVSWSATTYGSAALPNFPSGYAAVTMTTNAIQSVSKIVLINPSLPPGPPIVDLNGSAAGYDNSADFTQAYGPAALTAADASIINTETTNIVSATITLSPSRDGSAESLSVNTTGTAISATYSAATGVLSLSGSDLTTNYQNVLRTLIYNNTSPSPAMDTRTATVVVNDGVAGSTPRTVTLNLRRTQTIVPFHSVWKYRDNGADIGTAWRFAAFSDSSWMSGAAILGYGEGDESTVVSYGPDANNKYITTYFRFTFNVADASAYTQLIVRLIRDDGVVVYLNGNEIVRDSMPTGTISFPTLASATISGTDERKINNFERPVAGLQNGSNLLAVEVHQAAANSSDLSFDLEFDGVLPPIPPDPIPTTTTAANVQTAYKIVAQNVTLTASVVPTSGAINSGSVTFQVKNGATNIGNAVSAPVVNSQASASYSLPGGTGLGVYAIFASYGGSGPISASADNSHSLTIVQAGSTVTAATTATGVNAADQNVTLNAAVTSPGGVVNEGNISFRVKNGASDLGTPVNAPVVSGAASAVFVVPGGTAIGDYLIQADFSATNFSPGTDGAHLLRIVAPNTMTAEDATISYKSGTQSVTLNATVIGASGPVNEGTVTFQIKNGAVNVGNAVTSGTVTNGLASVSYSLPANTAAGIYQINAGYSGSANFPASSDNSKTLTVLTATTAVNAPNANATYSAAAQNLNLNAQVTSIAGTVNQGTVTFTVRNGAAIIGSPVTSAALTTGAANVTYALPADTVPGNYAIYADYNGGANFRASNATGFLTITKAVPAITWNNPANIEYGTALSAIQLNASVPVPGTYTYNPVAGTFLNVGANQTLAVTFVPNDTSRYQPASKTALLTVNKKSLTVTADSLSKVYGTPNPPLTASYSGFVFNNTVSVLAGAPNLTTNAQTASPPGPYIITVTQGTLSAANYSFVFVNGVLTVSTTPVFALLSQPNVPYKTSDTTLSGKISYGATGTVQITFNGTTKPATIDANGNFSASFSTGSLELGAYPIQYYFPGGGGLDPISASRTLTIVPATPAIAWTNPSSVPYGTELSATQLNAATPVPGTFEYTPALGTLLPAGTHQLSTQFTPDDLVHYVSAGASVTLIVQPAAPVISWDDPEAIQFATPLSEIQLNATANVPGSFAYNPPAGTLLPIGQHQLSVAFTPEETLNYVSVTQSVSLEVTKAEQIINFEQIPDQEFGSPPMTISATASSNLPVVFSLVSGPAALTGNQLTLQGLGAVTIRAEQSGDDNFNAAAPVLCTFSIVIFPPHVTSALTAAGTQGQPFSYTLTATGTRPLTLEATNLPNGLNFFAQTGEVLGTPTGSGAFQIALTARNAAGSETKFATFVFASSSGGENHIPHATSAPQAFPNPAAVNQEVSFSIAVADEDSDAIAVTWDFGDGSPGFGTNVNHRYSAAGIFQVKATFTDGVAVDYLNMVLVVNSVIIPPDQYKEFEVAKASVKFNFAKAGKDALTLSGSVPVGSGFAPDGKAVRLHIGDLEREFTLTKKGSSSDKTLKLTGSLKNGTFGVSTVSFGVNLKNQPLFESLSSLGFVNDNTPRGMIVPMPVVLSIDGTGYLAGVDMKYAAKKDKTGSGKK